MELFKKWWFWVIVVVVLFFGYAWYKKRQTSMGSTGATTTPAVPVGTVSGA